jgi:hypothetical protein
VLGLVFGLGFDLGLVFGFGLGLGLGFELVFNCRCLILSSCCFVLVLQRDTLMKAMKARRRQDAEEVL